MSLPPDDPILTALLRLALLIEEMSRAQAGFRAAVLDQLADILELLRKNGPPT